jgi:uncharacterized protein (UPF0548 family)
VVTSLPPRVAAALRRAPFTYPEVGATAGGSPAGYHHFTRTRILAGAEFAHAGARLMAWRAHECAGLRVAASSRAEPEAVVLMRLGVGRATLRIPCRVVYVIDEPNRTGFAYGTLPGHPVAGEELFLVQRLHDGRVIFTVKAFSKPATTLARVAGPLTRWGQARMMDRYPRGLNQPSTY